MPRLMVQGDRDANGIEDAVLKLGSICGERGIGLNVGEAGKIVHLLAETGAHVRVHQAKPEPPNVPEGFRGEIVNCTAAALPAHTHLPAGAKIARVAWAIRLACLDDSDGFIFFPGREGTLAHLVPIMAFIAKGERDKGVACPRRVALVGWSGPLITALCTLFNIWPTTPGGEWLDSFASDEMGRAISWLTAGLPAER
ncbi:hypothetical protein HYW17_05180 [Candidatus Uhrbacteria bacterium]|nr:hypothetical protein [Candidatus Uhrbacteria bacterium]